MTASNAQACLKKPRPLKCVCAEVAEIIFLPYLEIGLFFIICLQYIHRNLNITFTQNSIPPDRSSNHTTFWGYVARTCSLAIPLVSEQHSLHGRARRTGQRSSELNRSLTVSKRKPLHSQFWRRDLRGCVFHRR